jgi:hypothetical protein
MIGHAHPKSRQRGVAAVEFGILVIPLLVMLLGLTEYGRAIYQYNTLAKAVRDATRLLTTVAPGNGWAEATCLAVYGNFSCDGNVLVPGLTTAMVSICDASVAGCEASHKLVATGYGAVNLVTVEIQGFQFQSLLNFELAGLTIGAPNITFGPIGNTMRQAL